MLVGEGGRGKAPCPRLPARSDPSPMLLDDDMAEQIGVCDDPIVSRNIARWIDCTQMDRDGARGALHARLWHLFVRGSNAFSESVWCN